MKIKTSVFLVLCSIPCIANEYPSRHEIILSDHFCETELEKYLEQYPDEKVVVTNPDFNYKDFKVTINISEDFLIKLIYGNGSPELFAKFFKLFGKYPLDIIAEENNLFSFQYGKNFAKGSFRMLYAGADTLRREGRLIYCSWAKMLYGLAGDSVVDLTFEYRNLKLDLSAEVYFKSEKKLFGGILKFLNFLKITKKVAKELNNYLNHDIEEIFENKIKNYKKIFEDEKRINNVNLHSMDIIYIKDLLKSEKNRRNQ